MPRYIYRCRNCNDEFETYHSISDYLDNCEKCNKEGVLFRVPSFFIADNKEASPAKIGDVVKNKIEEFRQDVKEEKQKLVEKQHK
jgi:putative FmdB family regulatory protein